MRMIGRALMAALLWSGVALHSADPISSVKLGNAYPFDVEIDGHYAYVADFNEGVAIVDIADVYHPKVVKKIPLDGSFGGLHGAAMDLSLVEGKLYVALGGEGFALIDVSDPLHPRLLGHVDTPEEYNSVAVDLYDNKAFLGSGNSGVVDVYTTNGGIRKETRFTMEEPTYLPLRIWGRGYNLGGTLKYSDLFIAGRENGFKYYVKYLDNPWDGSKDPIYRLDQSIDNLAPIDFGHMLLFGGGKAYVLDLFKARDGDKSALEEVKCGDGEWDRCISGVDVGVQELDGGWNTGLIIHGGDLFSGKRYLKRLDIPCGDGGIDLDGQYVYCGNKNTKSLEIYALNLKDVPWDLNGDGIPDIVLLDRRTGRTNAYFLDHEMTPRIRKIKKLPSTRWRGWGYPVDLDRDGRMELLFRNVKNGDLAEMALGESSKYDYFYSFLKPGRNWLPVAAEDDNDDRYVDIFLRNRKDGKVKILDIEHRANSGYPRVIAKIDPGAKGWKLLKIGKMNRDATIDLVFYHPAKGKVKIYYRNRYLPGDYRQVEFSLPNPKRWSVIAAGDLNGDGRGDLLLRRKSDGAFRAALVQKGKQLAVKSLGRIGAKEWKFVALTKIDRDRYPEIVLQNRETGTVKIVKLTRGSKIKARKQIVVEGPEWRIRRIQDLDKDGFRDLILQNRQNGDLLLCLVKKGLKVKKKELDGLGRSWGMLGSVQSPD